MSWYSFPFVTSYRRPAGLECGRVDRRTFFFSLDPTWPLTKRTQIFGREFLVNVISIPFATTEGRRKKKVIFRNFRAQMFPIFYIDERASLSPKSINMSFLFLFCVCGPPIRNWIMSTPFLCFWIKTSPSLKKKKNKRPQTHRTIDVTKRPEQLAIGPLFFFPFPSIHPERICIFFCFDVNRQ